MMQTVNIHEAKTQFSRLLEAVAQGEEVIIARAGKPVAQLVAIKADKPLRQPGALKGRLHFSEDFDAPLPADVLAGFEGQGE